MASQAKRPKQDFIQIFNEQLCKICECRLSVDKPRWYRCQQRHHLVCQDCLENPSVTCPDPCNSAISVTGMVPLKIEMDDKVFLFVGTSVVESDKKYFWVQFLGSPNEAKNYSYTLVYISKKSPAVDETSDSIIQGQKRNEYIFENFICLGKDELRWKFCVQVKIRNLKEEAMDENENVKFGVSDNNE